MLFDLKVGTEYFGRPHLNIQTRHYIRKIYNNVDLKHTNRYTA